MYMCIRVSRVIYIVLPCARLDKLHARDSEENTKRSISHAFDDRDIKLHEQHFSIFIYLIPEFYKSSYFIKMYLIRQ